MQRLTLPFALSVTVIAAMLYYGSPSGRLVPNGGFVLSLCMGFVITTVVVLPVGELSRLLVRKAGWPAWSRIAVAGGVYLAIWLGAYAVLPEEVTGMARMSDITNVVAVMWALAIPYQGCSILLDAANRKRMSLVSHQPGTNGNSDRRLGESRPHME
jgi:hypothetical protein